MNARLRQQRTNFLLFLGVIYLALIAAPPLMTASLAQMRSVRQASYATTPPTFEQLDRNRDGYIDAREAAAFAGLATLFSEPDRRLDKVEYAKALALLDGKSRP